MCYHNTAGPTSYHLRTHFTIAPTNNTVYLDLLIALNFSKLYTIINQWHNQWRVGRSIFHEIKWQCWCEMDIGSKLVKWGEWCYWFQHWFSCQSVSKSAVFHYCSIFLYAFLVTTESDIQQVITNYLFTQRLVLLHNNYQISNNFCGP